MKKFSILAVLLSFSLSVFAAANAMAGALDDYREFVAADYSSVMEIARIMQGLGVAKLDETPLSGEQDDPSDYMTQTFRACKFDPATGMCLETQYILVTFHRVLLLKGADGKDSYKSEPLALVFTGPKIVWFKSEAAKQMFIKMVLGE